MNASPIKTKLHRKGGFTLIELMVAISIIAIFALIGLPAFDNLIQESRIRSQSGDLLAQLAHARSEAMRTSIVVTICPGESTEGCNGQKWSQGWIAFFDKNSDKSLNADEKIIIVNTKLIEGITLHSTSFSRYLSFNYDGSLLGSNSAGSFIFCDGRGFSKSGRVIKVNMLGRLRILEKTSLNSKITKCGT